MGFVDSKMRSVGPVLPWPMCQAGFVTYAPRERVGGPWVESGGGGVENEGERSRSRQSLYWRANLRLMTGLLIIWFTVSYGFGILLVEPLKFAWRTPLHIGCAVLRNSSLAWYRRRSAC